LVASAVIHPQVLHCISMFLEYNSLIKGSMAPQVTMTSLLESVTKREKQAS